MNRLVRLSPETRVSLQWWLHFTQGCWYGIINWTLVTMDASLRGCGAVILDHQFQCRWSCQEVQLPINVLELRAIANALLSAVDILRGRAIRVQSDNAMAVAYVNRQGGTRSRSAMRQVRPILPWAEHHAIALSAVFVPGVDNWEANYLSRQDLHPGELGLHPDIFHQIAMGWGLPEVDLMASRLNKKVDALSIPWTFSLAYLFTPLPLLPRVLKRIKRERVVVMLVAPDWPRRAWFSDLGGRSVATPRARRPTPARPLVFPDLDRLRLTAWLLKPRC